MSIEMSPADLTQGLNRLMVPHCTPEINMYIIKSPQEGRIAEDFRIDFALACFPEDEHGEHLSIVPWLGTNSRDYFYKVLELNAFDLEDGSYIQNIDGWIEATKKSVEEKTPIFALTFGKFVKDSAPAIFLHVRSTIRPEEAMYFLNEFAQKKLFGKKLEF